MSSIQLDTGWRIFGRCPGDRTVIRLPFSVWSMLVWDPVTHSSWTICWVHLWSLPSTIRCGSGDPQDLLSSPCISRTTRWSNNLSHGRANALHIFEPFHWTASQTPLIGSLSALRNTALRNTYLGYIFLEYIMWNMSLFIIYL